MYAKDYREHKPRKVIIRMDPDCAICRAPANLGCDCEAHGLEVAISQAEKRMMQSVYDEIRSWVREHARDFILEYFGMLKERRLQAHDQAIERIKASAYYYHTQPHPGEIQAAQAVFKRGIDEDWQSSVQRYPEVLEYYYSLVELTMPSDDDPMVRDPPLSALSGSRKNGRRPGPPPATIASGAESIGAPTPAPNRVGVYSHPPHQRELRGRTPPPPPPLERLPQPPALDRRTPVPRDRRTPFRQQQPPPPPPSSYFPPY